MENKQIVHWTNEQTDYLEEWYGKKPLIKIAKTLNIDFHSVKTKKEKMGLTRCTEYLGYITAYRLAELINVDSHTVHFWINKKELPHQRKVLVKERENILIDIEEFWEWAENNQSLINFSKIEKNSLPPEPAWLDEARKRDFHSIPKRKKQLWVKEEDEKLWYLFYEKGYTQEKIGLELGRSRVGVQRRLSVLRKKKAEEANSGS